jgi:cell wall-associated NlpC family hydrolase
MTLGTVNISEVATAGPRVALVQRSLKLKVTHKYNKATRHAVKSFQHRRGIIVTGMANERTMKAIRRHWGSVKTHRVMTYRHIMSVARNQKGDPYVFGANGPSSFDCSGLTSFVYNQATNIDLPHNASTQAQITTRISERAARKGDLVFFHSGGGVYHTAIYAGHHRIIEAAHTGTNVRNVPIWSSDITFGRVFNRYIPRP